MSLSTLADRYCPAICRPILNSVQQSPIGKRIASGTFWSVVGSSVGKGLTFIAMIFVARILGTQLYGELGLIRSTTDIFIGFSSFGVGTTATAYIAELLENDKQRVGRIIGLCYLFTFVTCLLAAVSLYFASPLICNSSILKASHLTNELRISIVMLIFMTFMGTQIGVMSGFQDFRRLAYANFITGIVSILLYVGGAYYWKLSGAIIAMGVTAFINVIVNSIFIYYNTSKYHVQYYFYDAWKELSVLWKSSLPMFLIVITLCIFTVIYRLILATSPNGFHELGIYIAITQIEMIAYFIPIQISTVILPLLCNISHKIDTKIFRYTFHLSLLLNMGIALLIVLPIMLIPQFIMSLFGEEFVNGSTALMIICIGLIFHSGLRTLQSIYISKNYVWSFLILTILFHFIQLFLLYYYLKLNYGVLGMALAYSITYVFYFGGTLLVIKTKV